MLLSALLHDQCRLQSSPSFQHQFVWHLFSRTLVCKDGSCHVHVSTRVVSPSLCYVAVSRARENNWDKPLLDDIIINCLCHHCKILIHGHPSWKAPTDAKPSPRSPSPKRQRREFMPSETSDLLPVPHTPSCILLRDQTTSTPAGASQAVELVRLFQWTVWPVSPSRIMTHSMEPSESTGSPARAI